MPGFLLLALLVACNDPAPSDDADDTEVRDTTPDLDEDGFTVGAGDCDDDDAAVYPGARDLPYDGVDADCAGNDDDDFDGDGHAALVQGGDDCADADPDTHPGAEDVPYDGVDHDCGGDDDYDADRDGYASNEHYGLDCDDADPEIRPNATDVPYDGVDANCDGRSDDDADRDGYDDVAHGGLDCDDTDFFVRPGVVDPPYDGLDQDCAGDDDFDLDGDGYAGTEGGGDDCDDADEDVHPGATDAPYDDLDADCAGDDDFDLDGDGWTGEPRTGPDCDDTDPNVYPGALDVPYDGLDADCLLDSDFDADGDGFEALGFGAGTDCDDDDDDVNPSAAEVCNGVDDDCDDEQDELDALDAVVWYDDVDGDGYGGGTGVRGCDAPDGWVTVGDDCDDDDDATHPGAAPVGCDGKDNDCDTRELEVGTGARIGATSYPSVAAAIVAAAPDDVVEVCEGRHVVPLITIAKAVTVRGRDGASGTVLDGGDANAIFEIVSPSTVTIEDLTLTRGAGLDARGGAVRVRTGAAAVLERLIVRGNNAGSGGGVYFDPSSIGLIRDSTVASNVADFARGALGLGGGVFVGPDADVTLDAVQIGQNFSSHGGGGLYLAERASVHGLNDTQVFRNSCGLAGGGVFAINGDALIEGIVIRENTTSNAGGGIYARNLVLRDVDLIGNESGLGGGGILGAGLLQLENVSIVGNSSGMDGPGIEAVGSDVVIAMSGGYVSDNDGDFGTRGSVQTGFEPWGEIHLRGGLLAAVDVDWGGLDETPDIGLEFLGEPTYELSGVRSVVCQDITGGGCF